MSAARSRYSAAAITFHWLIALLIIGNFVGGLLIENDDHAVALGGRPPTADPEAWTTARAPAGTGVG